MTETRSRKLGGFSGRKVLRTAIWAGLAFYCAYLSAAAMAEAAAMDIKPAYGVLGVSERDMAFSRPTQADPKDEIACLALNIYFEARGEPDQGKFAVGHVVLNRVAGKRFPDTICAVIRQGGEVRRHRCQFSWWCDGRSDKPRNKVEWRRSNEIALNVYWGRSADPTEGAQWYHADYVSPNWRNDFKAGPKIGRHLFYSAVAKGKRVATRRVDG